MSTTERTRTTERTETTITEYLSEHPRMLGVLFMILLVLTQAGQVSAGMSSSIAGP